MSGSFEKSVKGGTKIKLAPPKAKYVEHILVATRAGDAGVGEIFRALQNRLRDSTWTIVFKSLIIVHLMIREGESKVTLRYLSEHPSKLAISNFSEIQVQGNNIRNYHHYLLARAKAFHDTKLDWVREGPSRLKRLTVDKGLLRETEAVQRQIKALLQCDILSHEPENEITLTAYRLLTMDLLTLFHVMNEGTINVLEHYFEMSRYDAERALTIYKAFTKQTNQVVEYLSTARMYEHATRLEIPKLKHAPTSLAGSLEEYLNDKDFDTNRRQYLAQLEAKKGTKSVSNGAGVPSQSTVSTKSAPNKTINTQSTAMKPETKGPAPDLIDFFDSIEQNQQPMTFGAPQQNPVPHNAPQLQSPQQQTGFGGQQIESQQQHGIPTNNSITNGNPFGQAPQQHPIPNSGNGFDAFQQHQQQQQPQHTSTNGVGQNGLIPQQTSNNAFVGTFGDQNLQQQQQQQQQNFGSFQQNNGPSQNQTQQQPSFPLQAQSTGQQSTNPFRQSMFPQSTGSTSSPFSSAPPTSNPLSYQSTSSSFPSTNPSTLTYQPVNSSLQNDPPSFNPTSPARSSTNPFARNTTSPFTSLPPQQPLGQPQQQGQPALTLQSQRTGTNPFARNNTSPAPTAAPLAPQQTGSTNPFRQSTFSSANPGQSWQGSGTTLGGAPVDSVPTIPVFPRPGEYSQGQGQQYGSLV